MVKNLPAIAGDLQEMQVCFLGREDPLKKEKKEMAAQSVFFPRESQGQSSLVGSSPWGHKELDTTEHAQHTFHLA